MKKMTKIEEYSKEIPEEIRSAIQGLASDHRAAIFVVLYKHGELSFSGLRKKLEIGKAKLNYHLGKLIEGALVHHYYKHELGTEKYSFYNVTSFGQNFVRILSQFMRPRPNPILFQESPTTLETLISLEDIVAQQPNILAIGVTKGLPRRIHIDQARRCAVFHSDLVLACASNARGLLGIPTPAEESTNVKKGLIQTPTI